MASPFPGMDPFLEDPGLWPDVHHRLISIAGDLLGALLRPKYLVRFEERVTIADEGDSLGTTRFPDLRIVETGRRGEEGFPTPGAVTTETAVPVLATTMIEEARETYLTVIDRVSREVVTIIEVLSPTNKAPGSHGWASFEQKRLEVMNSPSHWVEIDLLRRGNSLPARYELESPCEYLVHVSRADQRPQGTLWPIRLSHRLPTILIPLRGADEDAPLELQRVLDSAFDRAGYDLEIDYKTDPIPPLDPPWAEWADRLLKAKGLR